jgi:hypothetical protein
MTYKVTIAVQFGQRDICEVYRRHCREHLWWLAQPWMVTGVGYFLERMDLVSNKRTESLRLRQLENIYYIWRKSLHFRR